MQPNGTAVVKSTSTDISEIYQRCTCSNIVAQTVPAPPYKSNCQKQAYTGGCGAKCGDASGRRAGPVARLLATLRYLLRKPPAQRFTWHPDRGVYTRWDEAPTSCRHCGRDGCDRLCNSPYPRPALVLVPMAVLLCGCSDRDVAFVSASIAILWTLGAALLLTFGRLSVYEAGELVGEIGAGTPPNANRALDQVEAWAKARHSEGITVSGAEVLRVIRIARSESVEHLTVKP